MTVELKLMTIYVQKTCLLLQPFMSCLLSIGTICVLFTSIGTNYTMFAFVTVPFTGPMGHVRFQSSLFTHMNKPNQALYILVCFHSIVIKINQGRVGLVCFQLHLLRPCLLSLAPLQVLLEFNCIQPHPVQIQSISIVCSE